MRKINNAEKICYKNSQMCSLYLRVGKSIRIQLIIGNEWHDSKTLSSWEKYLFECLEQPKEKFNSAQNACTSIKTEDAA